MRDTAIKRKEDLLARRWDKLQQQEVEESVRKRFGHLFSAEEAESARGERGVGRRVLSFLFISDTLRIAGICFCVVGFPVEGFESRPVAFQVWLLP